MHASHAQIKRGTGTKPSYLRQLTEVADNFLVIFWLALTAQPICFDFVSYAAEHQRNREPLHKSSYKLLSEEVGFVIQSAELLGYAVYSSSSSRMLVWKPDFLLTCTIVQKKQRVKLRFLTRS